MMRFLWAIAYSFGVLYVSGLAFKWIGVAPQPFSESDVYCTQVFFLACAATQY